ncbi:purine-cytosine permease family protein [Actinocrispum wychmicini]|uniref:Purine-cytosine permease-like protein n=1 Tax=Actinocrispum wychmicini TaxID=1213861 RepID=A0A4R2JAP6_9PSEU|nr:cytosine permease [Actinocrispum wychmicini]TCO54932.1 purine-cytosine permease-like protein [Actinocrispum wychmicini]
MDLTRERKGIDRVAEDERHGTPRALFWPWTAANLSLFPVASGIFVIALGLSWWEAVVAIVVGLVVSYPLVGLTALAGVRGGAPTMTLSRATFGLHGNKIPTGLSFLSTVGWEIISVALGALAARTALARLGLAGNGTLAVSFAVIALATIVICVYGYDVVMRVQKWLAITGAGLAAIYFVIIIPHLRFAAEGFNTESPTGTVPIVAGVIMVAAGGGLSWANSGADYSRYLPVTSSRKGVVGWTTFAGVLTPLVLMLAGVVLSAGAPDLAGRVAKDPFGALAELLPTWFLVPFTISVILSCVAGAVMNLYSSGLILLALGVPLRREIAVGIDGGLMVLGGIYLIFVAPTFFDPFMSFLTLFAVPSAAWAAIFITDMLLYRRDGYAQDELYPPRARAVRPAAVLSLVVAALVGWGLVTSRDPNIDSLLGYWLPDSARHGSFAASNLGVFLTFVLAGVLYAGSTFPFPAQRRSGSGRIFGHGEEVGRTDHRAAP